LHPIFTENNRTVDDRIIGDWASSDSNDFDFDLNIDSDEALDPEPKKIKELVKNSILDNSEEVRYRFERSSTLTYEKIDLDNEKNKSKVTITSQRKSFPKKSLLDAGYTITNSEEDPYYILTYSEIKKDELVTDVMVVNLTKIGNGLYMDFQNHEDFKKPSRFQTNLIPAHTFAKVEFKDNQLKIRSFDSDYIEDLIKSRKVRLKHEIVKEAIILTASTEDLRSFILKYGDDDKLYLDTDYLTSL
jgi:hypothetical protein